MEKLQNAIKSFLSHCQFEKNLSHKTLKAYDTDLSQFQTFLIKNGYPTLITEISKVEIRDFISSISDLKPKSIKRKIASIKSLFNYLEFEDILLLNPLRKMRIRIKEPRRLPTVLAFSEIKNIYTAAYQLKNKATNVNSYSYLEAIRNIVVIELLFNTGARVSEIANLKAENIDLKNGNIKIRGKGGKERMMQICSKDALTIIRSYSILYKVEIQLEGYFLINRHGKKLSDQSIRNLVKKLASLAGISNRTTPHTFRHSFATLLLEQDVDIKYIQCMLGHSSIVTTQIYTHVNSEKQRQILKTKHPRRDMQNASLLDAG